MSAVKVLSWVIAFGLFCSGEAVYSRRVSYKNEVLLKCSNLDNDVLKLLDGADIWRVDAEGSVIFRIARSSYRRMRQLLTGDCLELGNVEDIVRRSENEMVNARVSRSQDWFDEYHDFEEIMSWWKDLADNNEEVTYFSIGQSYEGRDVFAVNITASPDPDVPFFYFQCLIHSREWISGASCMFVVNEMMEAYKEGNEQVKNILEKAQLIFVPVVNPDGYVYTWTVDRLWRKNRRPIPNSACSGVDLNRNYNDHWGEGGSSGNPCSETYHGESAASEIEIKNVENLFLGQTRQVPDQYFQQLLDHLNPLDYARANRSLPKVFGAMDWHSFSQLILRPWGWTSEDTPDEARLKKLSEEMADKIKEVHNMTYDPIKIRELTFATGGSIDWFYSEAGNVNNEARAAGLAFELRDTGQTGFLLPPTQIIPNGEEIYPAVLHFIEDLLEDPLKKN